MAYGEELVARNHISLGGKNNKTGEKNPTRIEGYYLRTEEHADAKKKSGKGYAHFFMTENGEESVWGKTDMDKKLRGAVRGAMTLIEWTGKTKPTPNGDMIIYSVRQDKSNTIDVETANYTSVGEEPSSDDVGTDSDDDDQQPEPAAPRATAPKVPAKAPSAEQQAKIKAMLAGKKTA